MSSDCVVTVGNESANFNRVLIEEELNKGATITLYGSFTPDVLLAFVQGPRRIHVEAPGREFDATVTHVQQDRIVGHTHAARPRYYGRWSADATPSGILTDIGEFLGLTVYAEDTLPVGQVTVLPDADPLQWFYGLFCGSTPAIGANGADGLGGFVLYTTPDPDPYRVVHFHRRGFAANVTTLSESWEWVPPALVTPGHWEPEETVTTTVETPAELIPGHWAPDVQKRDAAGRLLTPPSLSTNWELAHWVDSYWTEAVTEEETVTTGGAWVQSETADPYWASVGTIENLSCTSPWNLFDEVARRVANEEATTPTGCGRTVRKSGTAFEMIVPAGAHYRGDVDMSGLSTTEAAILSFLGAKFNHFRYLPRLCSFTFRSNGMSSRPFHKHSFEYNVSGEPPEGWPQAPREAPEIPGSPVALYKVVHEYTGAGWVHRAEGSTV